MIYRKVVSYAQKAERNSRIGQSIRLRLYYIIISFLSCFAFLLTYHSVRKTSSVVFILGSNESNDSNFFNNDETYKFVIIMPTHERQYDKTSFYVKRAVFSIMSQKYRNWELYATGDYYINSARFQNIFRQVPKNKLFLYNMEKPGERNNLTGQRLWFSAGATASNNALDRAEKAYRNSEMLKRNQVIIARLDDDDTWHPEHLSNLVNAYLRYPRAEFVWSKGYYCTTHLGATIFPVTNIPDKVNNMPPTFGRTLHSTVSWKMKTFLSFRYRRDWEYDQEPNVPYDADMWRRMSCFMHARNMDFYHSSLATVEHLTEAGLKPCAKLDHTSLWYTEKEVLNL